MRFRDVNGGKVTMSGENVKEINTKYIPLREDQRELFLNCNTPEELEKLKQEQIAPD